ncbi:1-acyl-sn-glycerol-3-phosphate acyltransferase [Pelagivirga sediminicola]|uniref:1-acyl-sn-glycerol-3-phosphate acyltransferase n=1 Tax=Pelagivirga sediminicola TaxID=2170575 RepID=A0A2T7G402_9RHOB|nr:lysophospholipid acyltransferase family protein [Pelagivirga sediminicola]PVA09120.1 1-acyl-sn-glycerol-3-phosphate acyltransferase [Pelagivirga sediminicola]
MSVAARAAAMLIAGFARAVTAVRGIWQGVAPVPGQRIYFANHNSHGDFVLVWTVLPRALRRRTRPVAGADYWLASPLRRFIGRDVFNAVLIDRNPDTRTADPVLQMGNALAAGDSLILFPEGTRNMGGERLLPFKSGLYHLAAQNPDIDMVPVWIDNLNRVMPKGALVPVPLICTVTFGAPMRLSGGEDKADFLRRAEAALTALAPSEKG